MGTHTGTGAQPPQPRLRARALRHHDPPHPGNVGAQQRRCKAVVAALASSYTLSEPRRLTEAGRPVSDRAPPSQSASDSDASATRVSTGWRRCAKYCPGAQPISRLLTRSAIPAGSVGAGHNSAAVGHLPLVAARGRWSRSQSGPDCEPPDPPAWSYTPMAKPCTPTGTARWSAASCPARSAHTAVSAFAQGAVNTR